MQGIIEHFIGMHEDWEANCERLGILLPAEAVAHRLVPKFRLFYPIQGDSYKIPAVQTRKFKKKKAYLVAEWPGVYRPILAREAQAKKMSFKHKNALQERQAVNFKQCSKATQLLVPWEIPKIDEHSKGGCG